MSPRFSSPPPVGARRRAAHPKPLDRAVRAYLPRRQHEVILSNRRVAPPGSRRGFAASVLAALLVLVALVVLLIA